VFVCAFVALHAYMNPPGALLLMQTPCPLTVKLSCCATHEHEHAQPSGGAWPRTPACTSGCGWVKGVSLLSLLTKSEASLPTTHACEHWVASRRWFGISPVREPLMRNPCWRPSVCHPSHANTTQHNTTHPRAPLEEKAWHPTLPRNQSLICVTSKYEKLTTLCHDDKFYRNALIDFETFRT
jgi:hypothetical protein